MSSVTKITAGVKDLATVWSGLGKLFGLSGGWFAVAVIAIAALVAGLVWAYNNVEAWSDHLRLFQPAFKRLMLILLEETPAGK
ncbi:hypothetical protein [Enterococcus sp.]|uniref:hypothetical protein n=1 Tax=Enterococcus sp. TaxID=35783 RepID=UPI0037BFC377